MFRFTIRDMLWLTVVVALGVSWCIDRVSVIAQRAVLRSEQESVVAKKRELNARFLRLVDATDRLNNQQAQAAKSSNPNLIRPAQ